MVDLAGITGSGLIVGGVAWIHMPSGLIVAGVMLLTGAILASLKPGKKDKP